MEKIEYKDFVRDALEDTTELINDENQTIALIDENGEIVNYLGSLESTIIAEILKKYLEEGETCQVEIRKS